MCHLQYCSFLYFRLNFIFLICPNEWRGVAKRFRKHNRFINLFSGMLTIYTRNYSLTWKGVISEVKNLRTLFAEAKNSNENATLEIIDFFKPIIDRHVRQSKYSEDVRSELTLHLIEIIMTLDLDKLRCSTDYALINYIKKSLYHCYLHISMTEQQRRQKEITMRMMTWLIC